MDSAIEKQRLQLSRLTGGEKKSYLGQFLTPQRTARFMAGLFSDDAGACRLLDAGAGIGSLSAAFLDRWRAGELHFQSVALDAFELDPSVTELLSQTLDGYRQPGDEFSAHIRTEDFILSAVQALSGGILSRTLGPYTHAILNPPYKKIHSQSEHRLALRRAGIETVNLYSAFVALTVALTAPGGQIVAIIPRSFCNGPYYRPFRDFMLERAALRRIHLFESRTKAFKDDDVLQENVILHLERGGQQGPVCISVSSDDTFSDLRLFEHPFERIVFPGDPERFIHVPTSTAHQALELYPGVSCSLAELGLKVSTGPVVDFRLKEHLRDSSGPGTVPLLYPGHFVGSGTVWPMAGMKKPNAIERNAETEKWLYPNGFYCVVRRFSSKEEKRRIVAGVVDPSVFGNAPVLGFENHLNLFHDQMKGLPEPLAWGLAAYLNTTAVDESFRRFNGHTQVNATDLKRMKYPSREVLTQLGAWMMEHKERSQAKLDERLKGLVG